MRESYIDEFNQRFAVAPTQPGHAFLPLRGKNLDLIFALHHERTVDHDNTGRVGPCILQIEKTHWRDTLAHSRVTVYGHLDGTWSVGYGPHLVGRYNREGVPLLLEPLNQRRPKAVETIHPGGSKRLRVAGNPRARFTTAFRSTSSQQLL